ncbi:DUF2958 domain-containing protein [Aliarcobacter butzleri]|uniref:DUF2958 domain-containing protein n=1 Tax=Aliarcobacter butzleri TaxID=28197 RepID=UPI0024DEDD26|nr:DUF2958 domain-containing protein [Aliarcobacter butzleri]MDK2063339.1 DUF2958 domain-containing protein [Aliarcobacter butzleri]
MKSIFTEKQLKDIPELYAQDGKEETEVKVYLVVKLKGLQGSFCWLLTEYSPEEQLFFGFACLNDPEMAELGYISKVELDELGAKYPFYVDEVNMTLKEAKYVYIEN